MQARLDQTVGLWNKLNFGLVASYKKEIKP